MNEPDQNHTDTPPSDPHNDVFNNGRDNTILVDSNGHFDLSEVHSVTPQKHEQRTLAVLHFRSGHTLATDSDYQTVADIVFAE